MDPVGHISALWALFERGGLPALLDAVHEDCEWHGPPELPGAGDIRGRDEMDAFIEGLQRDGVRYDTVAHRFESLDDEHVLATGRLRVVTRTTLSDSPAFYVYGLRGERLARVDAFDSRREALSAARG